MNTPLIVTTYHRPRDTKTSLDSLFNTKPPNLDIYIIDNSQGAIDDLLMKYPAALYRNASNIGKARGVLRLFNNKFRFNNIHHFYCADADIEYCSGWFDQMEHDISKIDDFGILAPTIVEDIPVDEQVATNKWTMHVWTTATKEIHDGIFYNSHTAGCLIAVNSKLLHNVNNTSFGTAIYGSDDNVLCKMSVESHKFVGITTNISVKHLGADNTIGYRRWKMMNINRIDTEKGYWDP